MPPSSQAAVPRLAQADVRPTPHRVQILNLLSKAQRPMSHLELTENMGAKSIDRVTLYRVLNVLSQAELIHQVQGTDGIWRYCYHEDSAHSCPGGHPHLLCESCGQMQCLEQQELQRVEVPSDFEVSHKQMLIIGRCASCINPSHTTDK